MDHIMGGGADVKSSHRFLDRVQFAVRPNGDAVPSLATCRARRKIFCGATPYHGAAERWRLGARKIT